MAKKDKQAQQDRDWKNEVKSLFHKLSISSNRYNLACLVEDDKYDFPFWSRLIVMACPHLKPTCVATANFEVGMTVPPPNGVDKLMQEFADELHKELILCRDTDNKTFFKNQYQSYFDKPYLYHTYAYDRESLLAYPPTLEQIFTDQTLQTFDFEELIKTYSQIIFPVLPFWIHAQEKPYVYDPEPKIKGKTSLLSWKNIGEKIRLDLEKVDLENIIVEIKITLKDRISYFLQLVKTTYWEEDQKEVYETEIAEITNRLNQVFEPEKAVFYFNGHETVEGFLIPFFVKMVEKRGKTAKNDTETLIRESYQLGNPFVKRIIEKLQVDFS